MSQPVLFRCLHCNLIRHRHCSRVCRLDPDHPDTPHTETDDDRR
ncbi:hypothetical protein SEA_BIRDSONG_94 [Gordonia phage Birdsong]